MFVVENCVDQYSRGYIPSIPDCSVECSCDQVRHFVGVQRSMCLRTKHGFLSSQHGRLCIVSRFKSTIRISSIHPVYLLCHVKLDREYGVGISSFVIRRGYRKIMVYFDGLHSIVEKCCQHNARNVGSFFREFFQQRQACIRWKRNRRRKRDKCRCILY